VIKEPATQLWSAVIHHRFCFSCFLFFVRDAEEHRRGSSLPKKNRKTKAAINRRTPNSESNEKQRR
jgi:hypothetical protein